jgi:hypothetical protein
MIDQEMLQAYRQRWQSVADLKQMEQQQETIAERWRKLNALLRMAAALGLRPVDDEQQEELVRQRWNRLAKQHLAAAEHDGHS